MKERGDKFMSITKKYIVENLDCANCGAKLEREIANIPTVTNASLTFMTKKLEVNLSENSPSTDEKIMALAKKHDVVLKAVNDSDDINDIDENSHNHSSCSCSSCESHQHNNQHSHEHNHEDEHSQCDCVSCSSCSNHNHNHEDKSDHHEHNHSHDYGDDSKFMIKRLILAVLMIIGGFFAPEGSITKFAIFFLAYLVAGADVLINAIKNIFRGQFLDENFLMAIATVGAFAIGEYPEGIAVMLFYQVGELFQDWAVDKSRKSIAELMNIKPDHANVIRDGKETEVTPENVKLGETIAIKTGEKIPLDCKIIEGISSIDTSALTGESLPRTVQTGDVVESGTINLGGRILAQTTTTYKNSTVARILELVEKSASKKSQAEKFITKFARYYTPIVVATALLIAFIPPMIIPGATLSQWIYKGLVFLVVSCPCALVISVPLSFFGGIGGASACGILVKGGNYLESLANCDTVVFDKTGTLTKGAFSIDKIIPENVSEQELLRYAALAQQSSTHPIAKSILLAYDITKDDAQIKNTKDLAGKGVMAEIDGDVIAVGNKLLMDEQGAEIAYIPDETSVFVSKNGVYIGTITLSDTLKEDAQKAINDLKELKVSKTVILSGDNENAVMKVKEKINADVAYGKLLPENKVDILEEILEKSNQNKKVAFVGDGINDAPVLARADIGIAMGGVGSDAAIEAADVVIMTDEPSKIALAIKIARKTMKIVFQNIYFAIGVKILVMVLATLGYANMWAAVFADVGVCILAIFNSIRTLSFKNKHQ